MVLVEVVLASVKLGRSGLAARALESRWMAAVSVRLTLLRNSEIACVFRKFPLNIACDFRTGTSIVMSHCPDKITLLKGHSHKWWGRNIMLI